MSDTSEAEIEIQTQNPSEFFTGAILVSPPGTMTEPPGVESMGLFTSLFQIVLGVLILAGNLLILVVFRKSATLGTTTRFLLGNLAVADLMFGATSIIRGGVDLTGTPLGEGFCPHLLGLMCCAIIATAGTAAAVSAHASYIVHQGAMYTTRRSLRCFVAVQGAVWLVSVSVYLLGGLLPTVPVSRECAAMSRRVHPSVPFTVTVCMLLGLLVSVTCHVITARRLAAFFSEIRKMEEDEEKIARELENLPGRASGTQESNVTDTTVSRSSEGTKVNGQEVSGVCGQGQGVQGQEVLDLEIRTQEVNGNEARDQTATDQEVRGKEVNCQQVKGREVKGQKARMSVGRMRRYRRERHGFLLILTVTLVMFACVTPAVVVHLIAGLAPRLLPHQLPAAMTTLALLNSLMNAVIYFVKDSSFRERCRGIFRCQTHIHPV